MIYPDKPVYASTTRMYEEIKVLNNSGISVDILFFIGFKSYLEYLQNRQKWIKSVKKATPAREVFVSFRFPHDTNPILKFFSIIFNFHLLLWNFSFINIKRNYSLLHGHNAAMSFYGSILRKFKRIDNIFDCHGIRHEELKMTKGHYSFFRSKIDKFIEIFALKESKLILTVSLAMQEYIAKISKTKSICLPMCINSKARPYSIQSSRSIRKYLEIDDKIVLVYSGSFSKWQCFSEMVEFFSTLKTISDDYHFLFLIPKLDKKKALSYITKNGIRESSSIFSIRKTRVKYILSASDIGVMLRLNSPVNLLSSPTKFSEYLYSGLPVITTNFVGDFSALVRDNNLGSIVDLKRLSNSDYIEKKLSSLNIILRNNKPKIFRDFITSNLSWENCSKDILSFYLSYSKG